MKKNIRKSVKKKNPNQREMYVDIYESFNKVHIMNQKVLKLLAKFHRSL